MEITDTGERQVPTIFGITLPFPSEPQLVPEMANNAFGDQAIWGVRRAKGVSTCSIHVQSLHGRLNDATRLHRTPLGRLAAVLHLLMEKAEH
jgi:hypothetical protein